MNLLRKCISIQISDHGCSGRSLADAYPKLQNLVEGNIDNHRKEEA